MNKKSIMIVAGAFLLLFTCIGLGTSGLTLFYTPVTEDLGFSQTSFSLYFSLSTLSGMFFMPVIGRILTGHMERALPIIIGCAFMTLLSFVGYAFCNELWQFYAVSIFRGIITAGISPVPATMLINQYITSGRNKAMAVTFTGSSFGGIAYTQLSQYFISHFGWRAGYASMGVAGCLVTLIAAALILQGSRDSGTAGNGASGAAEASGSASAGSSAAGTGSPLLEGYTFREALASPIFYLFLAGVFAGSIIVMGVQQGVVPALTKDHGFSTEFSAMIYSLFMVFMVIGKLFFGWLADKTNSTVTSIYVGAANMLAMLIFIFGVSTPQAYAFAVVFGFANMTATVLMTELTTTIFGTREYGSIYGVVNMIANMGLSIGPLLTAMCVDNTGTYRMAWMLYFLLAATSTLIFLFILRKTKSHK